ncbi:hypothetical protein R1flu_000336 [Riccia fluitans]|uniref:Uncharacterized protein n=1 Tax=Riccia fluitans TaxID=41844 RepID=A0ABD1Y0I1_9MARC
MALFKPHCTTYMSAHRVAFVENLIHEHHVNWARIFHLYIQEMIKTTRAEQKGTHYFGAFVTPFYRAMGKLVENKIQVLGNAYPHASRFTVEPMRKRMEDIRTRYRYFLETSQIYSATLPRHKKAHQRTRQT